MVSIRDQYDSDFETIKRDIDRTNEEDLLNTDNEKLTEYYLNKYGLPIIQKDQKRKIELKKHQSQDYGEVIIDIFYPIVVGPTFFDRAHMQEVISMTASQYFVTGQSIIELKGDWIKTTSTGEENHLKQVINNLETEIEWKNKDVRNGNKQLENQVKDYILTKIETIKKEYEQLNTIIEKMPIPITIRRQDSEPVIDFSVKEELKPLIKPEPETQEEPFLTTTQVATILKYIRNSCVSFEKTPSVFSKLHEEDLRDIIIGNLNAIFEGNATSETFSKRGKTDIYLRLTKGDILIMECKYWNGTDTYIGGLDQLFGYLTWRNNYAVLMTFSRNKGFMEVLQKAKEAAIRHNAFINNSLIESSLGYFITTHRFPNDSEKKVEIHHLVFDLSI